VYGWKRLGVVNDVKKVTPWWDQEVKDAVQAYNVAYSYLHSPCAEARKSAALRVK